MKRCELCRELGRANPDKTLDNDLLKGIAVNTLKNTTTRTTTPTNTATPTLTMNTPSTKAIGCLRAAAIIAAGLAATTANAGIVNYSNTKQGVVWLPANADLTGSPYEDDLQAFAFTEKWNYTLTSSVGYNAHTPNGYFNGVPLTPGTLQSGTIVNSYLIHFNPEDATPQKSTAGWIEFDGPIYVICEKSDLDATDPVAMLGTPGVKYAGVFSDREWDMSTSDYFIITQQGNGNWRLDYSGNASTGIDQMRIVETIVPAPGSLALLSLGGFFAARRRR
jgi:hypothetical protein